MCRWASGAIIYARGLETFAAVDLESVYPELGMMHLVSVLLQKSV